MALDIVQSFQGQQQSYSRRGGRGRGRGREQGSERFCYVCGDPDHIRPHTYVVVVDV
jgi:hypothetical protein